MTPQPIARLFKIADAYMIEFAKNLRLYFIEDQAAFNAEDSNFGPPFETDWQATINTAEAEPNDEQRKDQLTQLTNTVYEEMTNCRDTFQTAKRYIKKAFPGNNAVWNEFGFDDYDSINDKQPEMIQFMKRFHATAVKYTVQLTAPEVNFTAGRIAEIETRRAALDAANNAQEKFKKDLPVFTQTRVSLLNAVWNTCTDVAGVGKFLFRDDYARYQHYLLPPSEEADDTMVLSGIITDATTGVVIEGALAELQPHGLESESDSNGMYGFGSAPAGAATLRITHPLYEEQNIPVTIDPDSPQTLDVQLNPVAGVGSVTGVVRNAGAPVNGALVSIDGIPMAPFVTGPAGEFTLDNIPAGAQVLRAQLSSGIPSPVQTINIVVAAGAEIVQDVDF